MSNIVEIAKRPVRIFVCDCGCTTFNILESNEVECSACQTVSEGGGWFDRLSDADAYSGGDEPYATTEGNGSVAFARRRAVQIASQDDAALVVSASYDGGISAWSVAETPDQLDWCEEKLNDAIALIRRHVDGIKKQ